jgi:hypothetical protein
MTMLALGRVINLKTKSRDRAATTAPARYARKVPASMYHTEVERCLDI